MASDNIEQIGKGYGVGKLQLDRYAFTHAYRQGGGIDPGEFESEFLIDGIPGSGIRSARAASFGSLASTASSNGGAIAHKFRGVETGNAFAGGIMLVGIRIQTAGDQAGTMPGGQAEPAGNHDIAAIDRWERQARRASRAVEAAALRAAAARQRRGEAARRVTALRDERAGGGRWLQTATERAAAATEALAVARAHAVDALERAAEAHSASALAHEHAAQTANTLGDDAAAARHQDGAAQAHEAANRDHRTADEQRQQN